jgi:hypothetical protein
MKILKFSRLPLMLLGLLFLMSDLQGQVFGNTESNTRAVTPMAGNPVKGWHATKVDYSSADRKIVGKFQMEGSYWVERNNQGSNKFTETGRDEWSVYLKDVARAGVTVQLDLWVKKVICKPWNSQYIVTGAQGGYTAPAQCTAMSGNPVKGTAATKVDYCNANNSIKGNFKLEGNKWVERNNQGTYNFRETGRDEWSVYLKDDNRGTVVQLDLWIKKVKVGGNPDYTVTAATGGYTAAAAFPDPNAWYTITARHSGKSLDVPGASTADRVQLQQYPTHGGGNQLFQLQPAGGGYYYIKIKHSGKYLDVFGKNTANAALIVQHAYNGGTNQQFKLQDMGGGYYRIFAKHSGRVLDIDGGPGATATGILLHQWEAASSGGYNQHFRFDKR